MGQGRARFTDEIRVEVLKRWACSPPGARWNFGAGLGVPRSYARRWIRVYLAKGAALYMSSGERKGLRRKEWDERNAIAKDDIFNTPEDYWIPGRESTLPKQTANITKLNGGVLCVFDSCTISEMNRILCAVGAL